VCERESKTKAFSKVGLQLEDKVDPAELAMHDTADWIRRLLHALHFPPPCQNDCQTAHHYTATYSILASSQRLLKFPTVGICRSISVMIATSRYHWPHVLNMPCREGLLQTAK
jgi:hypothetical protein